MYGRRVTFRLPRSRGMRLRLPPATTFRVALIVLSALPASVGREGGALGWLVAFVCVTILFALRPWPGRLLLVGLGLEAVLASIAVVGTGGSASPLLPDLMAPALEAGTGRGVVGTAVVGTVTAITLALGRVGVHAGD